MFSHVLHWPVANMDSWQPLCYVQGYMEGCMGKKQHKGQSSLHQLLALRNSPPTEIKEGLPVNQMVR